MSETFIAFAGDDPAARFVWRAVSDDGAVSMRGEGSIGAIAEVAWGAVTLVLPGHVVTAHTLPVSARSEAQARAAAPYAIEDDVACDPETLHIALSPALRGEDKASRIAYAMDRDMLEAWIDALAEAGLETGPVFADHMLVPQAQEGLSAVVLTGRTLLRDAGWTGAVDHALGGDVVEAIVEAHRGEGPVMTLASETGDYVGTIDDRQVDTHDLLAVESAAATWSLRQGEFAQRSTRPRFDARRWIAAGMVATAALVTISGANLAEGLALRAETRALKADTEALVREAFPEVTRIVNARAQVRSLTETAGGPRPDFLLLSAVVTESVEANEAVDIQSLRFDAERGELSTSVVFDRYDDLAAFRSRIEQAGALVEEGGSRQEGSRRAGDLTVRLP